MDNPKFIPTEEMQRLNARLGVDKPKEEDPAAPAWQYTTAEDQFSSRQESEKADCKGCDELFDSITVYLNNVPTFRGLYCEACIAKEKEKAGNEERKSNQEKRSKEWAEICPDDYRDTDMKRVREELRGARIRLLTTVPRDFSIDDILRHDPKFARGLAIIGESGGCKTRIMFQLMHRLYWKLGLSVRSINASRLADELAATYEHGAGHAERFMSRLENAAILFIDDLGKEKMTERVEATYYRIVEYRKSKRLPLFFTANVAGDALIEKWESNARKDGFISDRAAPIVRRLREMVDSVSIQKPKRP